RGSRFANQVIHQGDGPKLPYQAVVIRQSAIYRQGRNAVDTAGGVVPHTGSGPVPTFVFFCDVQAGHDRRQQVADGTSASTTLRMIIHGSLHDTCINSSIRSPESHSPRSTYFHDS